MAFELFTGNLRSAPVWAADFGGREHIMPFPAKIDPAQFADGGGIPVVVTANTAQGATSIPVTALNYAYLPSTVIIAQGNVLVPAGTVLDFGGAKFARVTADALYGATTISVSALVTALVAGDSAAYSKYGTEEIPSGTFVGRTFTERGTSTPFGPGDPAGDDELFLTYFDIVNAKTNNDAEFYRPGSVVKENYLPGYTTVLNPGGVASATLTKIRSLYKCILGVN